MNGSKNYYDILGIPKTSTAAEIKQAYRKLAREHHPDMVKDGDKAMAEKRFKEVNEAYQILGDPEKKKMYDQYGSAAFNQGAGNPGAGGQWGPFSYTYSTGSAGGQGFGDLDPFDVFEEFFGFRGFGGSRKPRKGKNLHYELQLSFSEAVFGMEREISIESGKMKIKVPAGVRDGIEMRFESKGMPGPEGTPPGDAYITLRVVAPKEFKVAGDDILVRAEIDFVVASLGGSINVPVVDTKTKSGIGSVEFKIPAGTQFGSRFVLRGKGMPRLRSKGFGDAYIDVIIKTPTKISKKQKELLEQYSEL